MKKIIFILFGISLFFTNFAQLTYGPKLGGNISRLANDNLRPGFQLGAFVNGELYDRMGLQVDFLWTLKGNSHTRTDTTYSTVTTGTTTTINTSTVAVIATTYYRFVDVPICAYFPISNHIRGFAGPQLSVFRRASQTVSVGSKTPVVTDITGIKGQVSICLGFDFKFDSPIIFGVRFVTNKFTGGTGSSTDTKAQTLNSFMINVAYKMDW